MPEKRLVINQWVLNSAAHICALRILYVMYMAVCAIIFLFRVCAYTRHSRTTGSARLHVFGD